MYKTVAAITFNNGASARISIKQRLNEYTKHVGSPMLQVWDADGWPNNTYHFEEEEFSIKGPVDKIQQIAAWNKGVREVVWKDEEYRMVELDWLEREV